MAEKIYIDRPPRIQPELPEGEFTIPAPPTDTNREQPLLQLILPAIAVVGYVVFLAVSGSRSPLLVIPMLIIALASSAVSWMTNQRTKKERETSQRLYRERLREIRRTIAQQHDLQRQFYYHNHPNPSQALKIAQITYRHARNANNKNSYGVEPRLWERRPSDADFGTLRLGIGSRPSTVTYKLSDGASLDDSLYVEAMRLLEGSRTVSDVPITIALRSAETDPLTPQKSTANVRHALGITGRNAQWVYRFAWSTIANFATLHSPNDARLMILGTGEAEHQWKWATELPHSDPNNDMPICFEDSADMQLEKETSSVYKFLKGLRQTLDKRRNLLAERDNDAATVRHPFLLIVVDLLATPIAESRLRELESDPAISTLMEEGEKLGAAVIFLVSTPSKIPSGCQAQVEVFSEKADRALDVSNQHKVTFRYVETGVNATRYQGAADYQQHQETLQKFAVAIGGLGVRKRYGQDLPFPLHLLDLYPNVKSIDHLRKFAAHQWKRSLRPSEADWLRMLLGTVSGGEKRVLKLSADADGVHGLIAGSTGSGKSELLMTMILNLAIHYDPSIVNFVLVDFKGGGAFKPLESLPHVVDMVTNLKESAVDRMFASIKAELDRRAGINTYTNMKHLVEYRKRGLHIPDENGQYGQPVMVKDRQLYTAPYPHLFIFIDEFAEMIQANPAYKAQLESITRLGRALGVTLILAAQKPTGVTDQMRANIKFRIALRVETRDDSMEVLRRPDAAHLPNGIPGRGYLQVGYDNLEMIQIAWSGAEYTGRKAAAKPDVIWLNRPKRATQELQQVEPPKVFEETVRMLSKLSEDISLTQRRPWPDFLPDRMSLQTKIDASYLEDEFNIVETEADGEQQAIALNASIDLWLSGTQETWPALDWGNQAMRAVIGLIDNPQRSEQRPLYIDFRRGHAVVFGASGWGKTTFLRTTLTTLLATHSPDDLQAYILDFGSRQFGVFRSLRHVGAVITPDEAERTQRLLRKLDDMLDHRRRLLGRSDYSDLYAYNAADDTDSLPAVLVIIDNFAEFRENFEDLMPSLISLVRESRAYGIHFAISAELPNTVSGKLYSVLTERYALNLAVASEYTNIVGRGVNMLDEIPGRGLLRQERHVLEFQVALPVGTASDLQDERESDKLRALIAALSRAMEDREFAKAATPVEILPQRIGLAGLLPIAGEVERDRPKPIIKPTIGIDDINLRSWQLDLARNGPHMLIVGSPNTGKTTTLRTLILSLASSYTPDEVAIGILDFQQNLSSYDGAYTLSDIPHVVESLSNSDYIQDFIAQLSAACQRIKEQRGRSHSIFIIVDNYDTVHDDLKETPGVLPQLAMLAREFGQMGLHFVLAGTPDITRIMDGRLRRQVSVPRFGIALDGEGAERLNAKMRPSQLQEALPIGRNYIVKAGRTGIVQFGTPYARDNEVVDSLDGWVLDLMSMYPDEQLTWEQVGVKREDRVVVPPIEVAPADVVEMPVESAETPVIEEVIAEPIEPEPKPAANKPDIAELRRLIEETAGFSVETLGADDIMNVAISLGLIEG